MAIGAALVVVVVIQGSHAVGAPVQLAERTPTDPESDSNRPEEPSPVVKDEENPNRPDPKALRKVAIARCLAIYHSRQIDADVLRPWSIMHGLIAYGQETSILARGKSVNAVEYLCNNGIGDDRRILYVSGSGLATRVGPGYQGHEGQLLAILAQADVDADQPMRVEGHRFTVQDLIDYEKRTCRAGQELTFKLLSLSHYLNSDSEWKNDRGETWSIARLIRDELREEVKDGACGGTHRLMALSYAVDRRRREEKPIVGHWKRAAEFIDDYQEYALHFQGEDGSFSTEFFDERVFSNDAQRKLYTTGHILEWLVFSKDRSELEDPRVTRAVDFLLNLMLNAPGYRLDVGPRGHALHALRLYQAKMFGPTPLDEELTDSRGKPIPVRQATHGDSPSGNSGFPRRWPRRTIFGRR